VNHYKVTKLKCVFFGGDGSSEPKHEKKHHLIIYRDVALRSFELLKFRQVVVENQVTLYVN